MSQRKSKLNKEDHEILLALIRGEFMSSVAARYYGRNSATQLSRRLQRMRALVEVQTNYQLIALEVINLMEQSENASLMALLQPVTPLDSTEGEESLKKSAAKC